MLEVDPELDDFNYGPESYDAVMIIALAAQIADTDGIEYASEIINVTADGEKCTTYADCLALIEAGTDIDYDGVSGPLDLAGNGEPDHRLLRRAEFGDDNRIDDDAHRVHRPLVARRGGRPAGRARRGHPRRRRRPEDRHAAAGDRQPRLPRPTRGRRRRAGRHEINEAGGFNGQDVVLTESDSGDTSTDTATTSGRPGCSRRTSTPSSAPPPRA